MTLTFDGSWASDPFDISSSPSGPNTIEITARDVFGTTAQTNVTFQVDRLPEITMIQPTHGGLAEPLLRVELVAKDDLAVPRIAVSVNGGTAIDETAPHVTRFLDLSQYEGSVVTLHYRVLEPSRPPVIHKINEVLVLANPRYQSVIRVPGWIYDARGGEVLYTNQHWELVKHRLDGMSSVLATNVAVQYRLARITPTGAVYLDGTYRKGFPESQRLRESRNSLMIDHGPGTPFSTLLVRGNHGFLPTDVQKLRNFLTNSNFEIPGSVLSRALAENGTFFFAGRPSGETNGVFQVKEGVITPVDFGEAQLPAVWETDGTNVLYSIPSETSGVLSFKLRTPQTKVELTPRWSQPADLLEPRAPFVLMNGGWSAFPRLSSQGLQQIWLRSPEGMITQATFYSKSSELKALSASGDLVTRAVLPVGANGEGVPRIIYTPRGGSPVELGNDFGASYGSFGASYFFEGEQLYAYWGGTLFRVITAGEPIDLSSPQYDAASGLLSYFVTSAEAPVQFVLQRTTNFVDWAFVGTWQTVTNHLPTRFEASTGPGSFRLVKKP